ncbi:hypothetical protein AB0K25_20085 [Micromonospora sp. NPDC049257]|uniref:hypothetical protein n=1 Tax=Micromonospora sp. NPDC049257 TaxID=3155771 RepID=UPI00342665DD
MLILGVSSDDKGTQLEALVHTELESQGYVEVYSNVVGSGGNELDVTAKRKFAVIGTEHVTPVVCEAKAYQDPVNLPTWQKFLGKLFIQRSETPVAIGILVALSGVNGNVRGSYESLRKKDGSLFVFDGRNLLDRAREAGAIASEDKVIQTVQEQFRRGFFGVEPAYYGGGFFWVVRWNDEEYSVVNAYGSRLLEHDVENLRKSLEGSISGKLVATDEARAQAEARHNIKVGLIGRLLQGGTVAAGDSTKEDEREAFESLADEPYSHTENGQLRLVPANELDALGIARFFTSLFESTISVKHLAFMTGRRHDPYVRRLIDTLSEQQAGFTLDEGDRLSLQAVAPFFPSVWATLAQPMQLITTHRTTAPGLTDEATLMSDRNTFWDEIIKVVRQDFMNVFLRGFLYDHLGVADLDEVIEVKVKSKGGVVGTMKTKTRTAIRQLSDELVGEAGTRHALIRMLSTVAEPWEDSHPDPIPLEIATNGGTASAPAAEVSSDTAPLPEA